MLPFASGLGGMVSSTWWWATSLASTSPSGRVLRAWRASGSLPSLGIVVISDRDSVLCTGYSVLPICLLVFLMQFDPTNVDDVPKPGRRQPRAPAVREPHPCAAFLRKLSVSLAWKWPFPTSLQYRALYLFWPYHILPLISYLCVHPVSPTDCKLTLARTVCSIHSSQSLAWGLAVISQ